MKITKLLLIVLTVVSVSTASAMEIQRKPGKLGGSMYTYSPEVNVGCRVYMRLNEITVVGWYLADNGGVQELFEHVATKGPGVPPQEKTTSTAGGLTRDSYFYVFPAKCMGGVQSLPADVQHALYNW